MKIHSLSKHKFTPILSSRYWMVSPDGTRNEGVYQHSFDEDKIEEMFNEYWKLGYRTVYVTPEVAPMYDCYMFEK